MTFGTSVYIAGERLFYVMISASSRPSPSILKKLKRGPLCGEHEEVISNMVNEKVDIVTYDEIELEIE